MRDVTGGGAVEANRGATEALARRTGREDASSRGENMVGRVYTQHNSHCGLLKLLGIEFNRICIHGP